MRDVGKTRLACRTNENRLFVSAIAPPSDYSSANQQRCPEQQSRGRFGNRGRPLINRSRRGAKSLKWILFRTAPTQESCAKRKAKNPFPWVQP
jgi:hypothetical protein